MLLYFSEHDHSGLTNGVNGTESGTLNNQRKLMYYINNGVYGVFLCWKLSDITLPVFSLKVLNLFLMFTFSFYIFILFTKRLLQIAIN